MTRRTLSEDFELAVDYFAAELAAEQAETATDREKWHREAQRLANKITTANKQSAAPGNREIANEALRWWRVHKGTFNVSDFVRHCEQSDIGVRRRAGGQLVPPNASTIRKIVTRTLGIPGKAGRPPQR